jgi:hypothetical protein
MSSYVGVWNLPTIWEVDFRQLVITVDGLRYGIPQRRSLQGVWVSLDSRERACVARTMASSRTYNVTRHDISVLCMTGGVPDEAFVRFYRMD